MPTFYGDKKGEHPKRFLRNLETYMSHKRINAEESLIAIENCLKGKAAKWFSMVKDATINIENFKELFLKYFFSESKQWDIFIQCTEAGKTPIKGNFQEHFYHWMDELKYLDSPKISEDRAINLVTKHLPIAIQAYVQTTEKKFLSIWEKLGEVENSYHNECRLAMTTHEEEETPSNRSPYNTNHNRNYYPTTNQRTPNNNLQNFRFPRNNIPSQNKQSSNNHIRKSAINGRSIEQIEPTTEDNIIESDEDTKNWEWGTANPDQLQSLNPTAQVPQS